MAIQVLSTVVGTIPRSHRIMVQEYLLTIDLDELLLVCCRKQTTCVILIVIAPNEHEVPALDAVANLLCSLQNPGPEGMQLLPYA